MLGGNKTFSYRNHKATSKEQIKCLSDLNIFCSCQKRLLDFPCCNILQFLIDSLMQLQIHFKRSLQTECKLKYITTISSNSEWRFYIFIHVCVELSQGQEAAGTNWNMGNCISTYKKKKRFFFFFSLFDGGHRLPREVVDIQNLTGHSPRKPDPFLSRGLE